MILDWKLLRKLYKAMLRNMVKDWSREQRNGKYDSYDTKRLVAKMYHLMSDMIPK